MCRRSTRRRRSGHVRGPGSHVPPQPDSPPGSADGGTVRPHGPRGRRGCPRGVGIAGAEARCTAGTLSQRLVVRLAPLHDARRAPRHLRSPRCSRLRRRPRTGLPRRARRRGPRRGRHRGPFAGARTTTGGGRERVCRRRGVERPGDGGAGSFPRARASVGAQHRGLLGCRSGALHARGRGRREGRVGVPVRGAASRSPRHRRTWTFR